MFGLEIQIAGYGFHNILRIVKTALNGNVEDVLILQGIHLGFLEFAHSAGRRKHKDLNTFAAFHGVLGSAAGIPAGGTENVQPGLFTGEHEFKQRT